MLCQFADRAMRSTAINHLSVLHILTEDDRFLKEMHATIKLIATTLRCIKMRFIRT